MAREPHTETITLSLDYGAALSPPGSLWSTRRLDNSTSSGGQAGDAGAHHGESSTEGLQQIFNRHAACWRRRDGPPRSYRPESIARRRHGRPSLQGRHMTFRCPSMPPELQIGPRARAQMSFAVRHLLGTLAVGGAEDRRTIARLRSGAIWTMGRAYPRVRKAPVPRRCLGFALQPLPRATAAATQGRRAGCCCSSMPAAAARGSGSSRCRTSPKASPPPTPTTGFCTGAGARPPFPRTTHASHLLTLGASVRSGSSSSRPSS